jgi:putative spermidine/putrescine transport system ATP-binding protein
MSQFDVVLERVSKTYPGGARAVIDFNAEIEHGEFVAMLGPSGCGKTTTLRMIGGLEEVTEGTILIAGKDVTDLPPARRDTSMMFQSFALFPHRTVFQNVEFSLKMKGMEKSARDRRVWEMLEMVGLVAFATRRPSDLSGGQQQRVALARALISRPTVLLLDEPLGSLDFNLRQAMMIELKKVQRELNITFIMVTHSQQEALSLADKVIVMSDAVIQQIGTSREVHENPRTKAGVRRIARPIAIPQDSGRRPTRADRQGSVVLGTRGPDEYRRQRGNGQSGRRQVHRQRISWLARNRRVRGGAGTICSRRAASACAGSRLQDGGA